jgi:hypothetical protein
MSYFYPIYSFTPLTQHGGRGFALKMIPGKNQSTGFSNGIKRITKENPRGQ